MSIRLTTVRHLPSPPWHGAQRAKRSTLWRRLKAERKRFSPRPATALQFAKAWSKHHTKPAYRELMPQGGGWGKWSQNWSGSKSSERKEQKDKSKGKGSGGQANPSLLRFFCCLLAIQCAQSRWQHQRELLILQISIAGDCAPEQARDAGPAQGPTTRGSSFGGLTGSEAHQPEARTPWWYRKIQKSLREEKRRAVPIFQTGMQGPPHQGAKTF